MKNKFYLLLLILTVCFTETLQDGINYYENRSNNYSGLIASNENIDKAIQIFKRNLELEFDGKAALYLLKSYYFKGEVCVIDIEQKKEIFNKGKLLGEKYIDKYPNQASYRYWYLVNLGSWAKSYGIISAAREGVADIMREQSLEIIKLDKIYKDGGGYFMLGAVNFSSPYIPFLLSWPDNDIAVKYLIMSVDTGEATLNQKNYLAQALFKQGKERKAKKILKEVINSQPQKDNLIEDINDINEAKQILKAYLEN